MLISWWLISELWLCPTSSDGQLLLYAWVCCHAKTLHHHDNHMTCCRHSILCAPESAQRVPWTMIPYPFLLLGVGSATSIAELGTLQQTAHWHGWLWSKPRLKWAALKAWRGRNRLKCTLMWFGGLVNIKRATFHRCFPELTRRFYSKRQLLLLGALPSEAAGLLTNFSQACKLIDKVTGPTRMCTCSMHAHAQEVKVINWSRARHRIWCKHAG